MFPGEPMGVFMCQRRGHVLRMIASGGPYCEGWEHVSVSLEKRCPTWEEMCFVKDLFWLPGECVMQLHPPEEEWVNNHPFCLHLWRPLEAIIPLPPSILVGDKKAGLLKSEAEAHALRQRALKEFKP